MKIIRVLVVVLVILTICFQNITISDEKNAEKLDFKTSESIKFKYDEKIKYPLPFLMDKYFADATNPIEFSDYANSKGIKTIDFKVQVVIDFTEKIESYVTSEVLERFEIQHGRIGKKWITGYIPIYNFNELLKEFPNIQQIRQVYITVADSTTSEGFAKVDGPSWHSAGFSGSGIKIAIIDHGFEHISSLVTSGDFTSSYTSRDFTGSGFPGSGDHGTECAAIVYDFAPSATYYLIIAKNTTDIEDAKDYCITNGIKVVSMSLSVPGYFFGDGLGYACNTANDANSNGILWVNSAGNDGRDTHWTGTWSDTDTDNWHNFSGADETNSISLTNGETYNFYLTWDTSLSNSNQDYDLYLFNSSMNQVDSSENRQTGTQRPVETISYTATSTGTFHVTIGKHSANGSSQFRLYCSKDNGLEYASPSHSIGDPGTATGAFTVGAIYEGYWNNSTVPIESFSSRGPTMDARTKPDICGPDGTSEQYGSGNFFGTSGSCPHVAGAAAVYWSSAPSNTNAQVRSYLEGKAVDCGTNGKDNTFGYGKLKLDTPGPAQVSLTSPPNNATAQPTTITFQWQQPLGSPTKYQLQVSTNNGFSSTLYDNNNIASTSIQLSGFSYSTTYYWRVRAANFLAWGAWSVIWNLETIIPPGQVTLSSPSNNATAQPLTITLQWQQPSTGTSPFNYHLQVSTNSGFSTTVYDNNNIATTSIQLSVFSYSTTYYWRIRANNAAGWGIYSSVWQFTTIITPGQVILTSPSSNATGQATSITFQWQQPATGTLPFTYQLQVSTNNSFSTTYYDTNNIATTSQVVSGLSFDTTYFWRVRANNTAGWGLWSSIWQFTTIITPGQIILSSPSNNATAQLSAISFTWQQPSVGTTPFTYQLQVSINAGFTSTFFDNNTISSTSQQVSGLIYGSKYYWRVRADNGAVGSWSSIWQFSTVVPSGQVILSIPTNNSIEQPTTISFQWQQPSVGTTPLTYHLQVSTNRGFSSNIFDNGNISSTSQQVSGLLYNTKYYWRVRANNIAGWSSWSSTWQFTTVTPPGKVLLSSPIDNSTKQPKNIVLHWKSATGTTPITYQLQVSDSATFAITIFDNDNISNSSSEVSDLEYKTMFYWRVRAKNIAGWGEWSRVWKFTTKSKSSGGCVFNPDAENSTTSTFWFVFIIFFIVIVKSIIRRR
ncbi:MAG: fibronectin type III domain-containing protein [Planctomycetes bacterium]|nr:fibronectin type III domain-containing protein [Planctomycetota bacterium]